MNKERFTLPRYYLVPCTFELIWDIDCVDLFWNLKVLDISVDVCFAIIQATLGAGLSKEKSVIQCSIGDKAPISLCSLLPNKIECCPLNLEFDDDDEPVEFSVNGDRSIHLSGFLEYYEENEDDYEHDEDDSYPFIVTSFLCR